MSESGYADISPFYGYTPSATISIVFIVLFSVSAAVHTVQAIWFKYWIVFPTIIIGCLLEIIGWAARYWSSQNVLNEEPYLMQIITLIIAPIFFSAWCYTILGVGINVLGQQYSALPPRWYIILFVSCDFFSLVLQSIGGGWAASTSSGIVPKTPTNIMVGGIIFQLVSMLAFSALAVDFMHRAWKNKPWAHRERRLGRSQEVETKDFEARTDGAGMGSDTPYITDTGNRGRNKAVMGWWLVMIGTAVCSIMIIIRGFYRSVELAQGWSGYLITHEVYHCTLDGIPMIIAIVAVSIFHPGFFLPKRQSWK